MPKRQPVNSAPAVIVNRPLSKQGLAILRHLATTPAYHSRTGWGRDYAAGELTTGNLVARLRRPKVSKAVTRASLSRTLRRLWTAGLVELKASPLQPTTMSDVQQARRQRFAELEQHPRAAYAKHKSFVTFYKLPDRYGSAAAYLEAERRKLQRPPGVRVTTVLITDAGRAVVNSVAHSKVNRRQPTRARRG